MQDLKHEDRLLFLRFFTIELIKNTKPRPIPKILTEELEEEKEHPRLPKPNPVLEARPILIKTEQKIIIPLSEPLIRPLTKPIMSIKPKIQRPMTRIIPQSIMQQPSSSIPIVEPDLTKPLPSGFDLGKVNMILKDPGVSMIECPGPGKLFLVRSMGKIKNTKITLNEQEIRQVIEKFSEQARIPLATGIFKAAVGNLIITAILSEFAGSRFIITKKL